MTESAFRVKPYRADFQENLGKHWLKLGSVWCMTKPMPRLESIAPSASPQSLARREKRNQTVLAAARLTMPGRMVLSAKRELDTVHAEAVAPGLNPADRAALIGSACKLRQQLMDLLGTQKRPAAMPGRRPAQVMLDVSPGSPPPPPPDLEA